MAGHYYNKALPQATGLDKAKIEIRLKELTKNANSSLGPAGFAGVPADPGAPNENYAKRAELAKQDFNSGQTPAGKVVTAPPAQAQAGNAPVLKIISARWGGGNNWKDVTERAQEAYAKNALTWVWATTDYLKADPTPGWRKKLEIQYEIDNKPYKASIDEGGAFKPSAILKKMQEQMQ